MTPEELMAYAASRGSGGGSSSGGAYQLPSVKYGHDVAERNRQLDREDAERRSLQQDLDRQTVGAPGTLESLIPVWGSGRSAIHEFQSGNYGWGMFYTAMAVSDIFLVKAAVTSLVRVGATTIGKAYGKSMLPNSGPIIRSLGAASKAEMLAMKLKMNINSPTTRQVLNSLDNSVESFISTYRKSSIRSEIPGEFLNQTVEAALRSGNTTIRKLLTDTRFVK